MRFWSLYTPSRLVGTAVFAVALLLVAWLPNLVNAAQVTERSIELSSSSAAASNVIYAVKFTAATSAGAFVVDFCSNSPVVGQICTPPAGLDLSGASSSTPGFTSITADTSQVVVVGNINAHDTVAVELTGVTNPSQAGPIYARIVTYDTEAEALDYSSTNPGDNRRDEGAVGLSITPTVGVSGAVPETMTFCVSGQDIAANCAGAEAYPPVLRLGEEVGGAVVLVPGQISQGSIYTQVSTNAAKGAVVRLKSNAVGCGGLLRMGAPDACDILPALDGGISPDANEARFGVKIGHATEVGVNPVGVFQPAAGSIYNQSDYALNYVAGDETGVTSTFGDPLLDTNGAPASNKNMQLTFGATVTNSTPAGDYSADLILITTGRF